MLLPGVELRVPVADEKAQLLSSLRDHNEQVAGLLSDPGAIRIGRHPCQVDPPSAQFDAEQQVVAARRGAGSSPWRRRMVRMVVAET